MFETEEMFSFRDPFNDTYTVLGHCEMCGDEIRSDYEYSEDKDGNKFCSDECAKGFYGIRNMCVV